MNLWPNNHQLSFVVLTGDFGSGKTSFALNVDPILKGQGEGRTLHFDMENSAEEFEKNYEFDRMDMPSISAEKHGANWNNGHLFQDWWEIADGLTKAKHYSVLVVDDFAPLQEGNFMTMRGKDNMDIWSKVKADFEQKFKILMTRVDTVVVIVHLRNKRDNSKEKEPKGIDTLKKLASLMLYLDRDPNKTLKIGGQEFKSSPRYPYPAGYVLKTRLEVVSDEKDEFGDYIRKPLFPNRIPVCTPGALRKYMLNPSVKFGEDEQLPDEGVPGMNEKMTDEEKMQMQETIVQEQNKQLLNEGRQSLMKALIDQGSYSNEGEIMKAVKALGLTYTVETHQITYNQLLDYAEGIQ